MAALAVAMGIGRFAFTPILPMMQADLGVSVAAGGWLASANYFGYLLGALSAMAVRIPAAAAIRIGLALIGVVTVAMALTSHFVLWIGLRALAGVASAWVLVFASSWCLERLAPLGRPLLPSAVFAGVGVGIAIAGGACVVLMQQHARSGAAWGLLGVLALVVTALTWPVFGGAAAAPSERRRVTGDRIWNADRMRLVLCYGTFGFGYIVPATFIPVMAREIVRDPVVFGWAWPVFGIAAATSTFAAALLGRRLRNRRLWSLSHVLMAIGVGLPVVCPGIAGIIGAALFVGGTFMVATMTGMQEARLVGAGRATVLMAAMTAAFATGQIVGPLAVSYLARAGGGFAEPLLAACALLLVSAGTLFWSSRETEART
ncbi:MAG TPA: YbfB/YjiJ family MFS transporter [Methylomirabilota bacterium]|nr:YbfB/YjiJ family MFS transporter [Methylomirabilota bacterium]